MSKLVAFLLVLILAGCATQAERSSGVQLCRGGRCTPAAETMTQADLVDALYEMLKDTAAHSYTLCAADGLNCTDKDISFYVQGGPIPGNASISAADP